ncbi:MAG: GerW family sporulation protein [Peptococcaceae bacterium]
MDFTENIHSLFEKLQSFFRTETVVGDPIQVGTITLVPIISVSFGAGSGSGVGKDNKGNDGSGGGAGAGGKITPNAILVIKNDEVSVIQLNSKNSLEKIIDLVPEIMAKVNKETSDSNKEVEK